MMQNASIGVLAIEEVHYLGERQEAQILKFNAPPLHT